MIYHPHTLSVIVVVAALVVLVIGVGTVFRVPGLAAGGVPPKTSPSIAVSSFGYAYTPNPGGNSLAFTGTVVGNTTDASTGGFVSGQAYSSGSPVGTPAIAPTGPCFGSQFAPANPLGTCFTLSFSWTVSSIGTYVLSATATVGGGTGTGYQVTTPKTTVTVNSLSVGGNGPTPILGVNGNTSISQLPPSPIISPAYTWAYNATTGPTTVSFVDHSGVTGGNGAPAITWNFGDGGTGSGAVITHTYTLDATFVVNETLVATNSGGTTQATVSHPVQILGKTVVNCGAACQNQSRTNTTYQTGTSTPPPPAQPFVLTTLSWSLIVLPIVAIAIIVAGYAAGWKFAAVAGLLGGAFYGVGLFLTSIGVL